MIKSFWKNLLKLISRNRFWSSFKFRRNFVSSFEWTTCNRNFLKSFSFVQENTELPIISRWSYFRTISFISFKIWFIIFWLKSRLASGIWIKDDLLFKAGPEFTFLAAVHDVVSLLNHLLRFWKSFLVFSSLLGPENGSFYFKLF
jgi:hypothetical protein